MAEANDPVEGQEPDGGEGQEPTGNEPAADAAGSGEGQEPESGGTDPVVAELRAENAKRRREQRALEQRIEAYEKAEQERKDAELTAEEKLAKREQELKEREAALIAQARDTSLRAQVVALAGDLRIVDPDAVMALLDRGSVEWDESGQPSNVRELAEALLEAKPYLKGQEAAPAPPGKPAPAEGNPPGRQSAQGSGETDAQRRARLYGSGAGIWADPEQQGGGVVMPPSGVAA